MTPTEISVMKASPRCYLQHETMRVVTPYLVLGRWVLWALLMFTKFPKVAEEAHEGGGRDRAASATCSTTATCARVTPSSSMEVGTAVTSFSMCRTTPDSRRKSLVISDGQSCGVGWAGFGDLRGEFIQPSADGGIRIINCAGYRGGTVSRLDRGGRSS
jgi:hypothetical protein